MKQAIAAVESLITIILVVVGIVGFAYHGFKVDGWISNGVGKLADAYIHYPVIALGLTVALFFTYRAWRESKSSRGGKLFDIVVYFLMAAGTYFIGHYVISGEV